MELLTQAVKYVCKLLICIGSKQSIRNTHQTTLACSWSLCHLWAIYDTRDILDFSQSTFIVLCCFSYTQKKEFTWKYEKLGYNTFFQYQLTLLDRLYPRFMRRESIFNRFDFRNVRPNGESHSTWLLHSYCGPLIQHNGSWNKEKKVK